MNHVRSPLRSAETTTCHSKLATVFILRNKENKYTKKHNGRFWAVAIEIFHSVNELNPVYIQSLYEQNINSNRHKNDLKVSTENFVVFGGKSAKVLEPSIWNIFRQS